MTSCVVSLFFVMMSACSVSVFHQFLFVIKQYLLVIFVMEKVVKHTFRRSNDIVRCQLIQFLCSLDWEWRAFREDQNLQFSTGRSSFNSLSFLTRVKTCRDKGPFFRKYVATAMIPDLTHSSIIRPLLRQPVAKLLRHLQSKTAFLSQNRCC